MSRRASQQEPGGLLCFLGCPQKNKNRNSDSGSTLCIWRAVVTTERGFTGAIISRVYVVVRCISTTNLKSERALAWVALALGEERRRGAVDLAPRSLRSYCGLRLTIGCCENRVSDLGRSAILGSRTRVLDYKIPTCPRGAYSGLV